MNNYNQVKKNVTGIMITKGDYDSVKETVVTSIKEGKKLLISPLASHTIVKAFFDKKLRDILNYYDALYPDSQYVRWALGFLYGVWLRDRVYGPELMLRVCKLAEDKRYKLILYGNTLDTLERLKNNLLKKFPNLKINAVIPSVFRDLTLREKESLIKKIEETKTDILIIGMSSPLEQIFGYKLLYEKPFLRKSIVILPVGAAFDFISGVKPQAPKWIGDIGFEWLFRLVTEPKRLWKRYLIYGPLFIILVIFQKIRMTAGYQK